MVNNRLIENHEKNSKSIKCLTLTTISVYYYHLSLHRIPFPLQRTEVGGGGGETGREWEGVWGGCSQGRRVIQLHLILCDGASAASSSVYTEQRSSGRSGGNG